MHIQIPVYQKLMALLFPIIKHTIIKRRIRQNKEHPERISERLGQYTFKRPDGKLYWFHGASVGEAISMLPLIDKLLSEDQDLHIMVTTGTITSAEIMQKRLPKRAFHQFIPFDVKKFAQNLITHFKPDAVLWFESELWPSLIYEIKQHNIPLILVNGRISDSSFKNWKLYKSFIKEMLSCFSLCLGQSEQDKNRLKALGAPKVACVGNIKFSPLPLPINELLLEELKTTINQRPVLLLSSTHNNEEEMFSHHAQTLKQSIKDLLIISVPRHPERGKEIQKIFHSQNLNTSLRSKLEPITSSTDVYIADTIGEMGLWYSLASVSFIGGSLIPHGGQNFIEPSRLKNAVILGPHMHNFKEMLEKANLFNAVYQSSSLREIIKEIIALYNNPKYLEERQAKAYNWATSELKVLDNIKQALQEELKL